MPVDIIERPKRTARGPEPAPETDRAETELRAPGPAPASDRAARPAPAAPPATARRRRGWLLFSPLTLRILAVNVLALAILVGGLMQLGAYKQSLIDAEITQLKTEGEVFAAALGESAITSPTAGPPWLDPDTARALVRRLVQPTGTRARLFSVTGDLIADSRTLIGHGGFVHVEELPPPRSGGVVANAIVDFYDWFADLLVGGEGYPPYRESTEQRAADYEEVIRAIGGESAEALRSDERGLLVVAVAVPVQQYKKIIGALLLTGPGGEIEQNLRARRLEVLKIFAVVLAVTVLLSLYLARTIARPITRLAAAAERVRRGRGRQVEIPDFSRREDEIGDLSGALRDMTGELWRRMDAIERFAADVSHEIKNPLSSLRSAVETVARVEDPARRQELMAIILEDVQRLDRLISDISHASRLDSQLSRDEWQEVDVARLLAALVSVHEATAESENPGGKRLDLAVPPGGALLVRGNEDQLVQVFRNIISNALSFAPEGSTIRLAVGRDEGDVKVTVDDEGPGIPENNLEAIFERFYSARPAGEKFGTHSGLGLSISRQIVEAHGGSVEALNRRRPDGTVAGARFVVRLPVAEEAHRRT